MSKFFNLSTVATIGIFLYWSSGFFLTLINLFYPNFNFPWQTKPVESANFQGKLYKPLFDNTNEKFNFYLFIRESAKLNLNGKEEEELFNNGKETPYWFIKDINPLKLSQELNEVNVTIPKSIWKRNKGQLYFHSILCPNKFSPYKKSQNFNINLCSLNYGSIVKYEEVLKDNTVNLLDKKQSEEIEDKYGKKSKKSKKNKKEPKLAHLKPYIHINLVFDQTEYPLAFVPNDVAKLSKAINNNNQIQYLPWVYHNEIGLRRDQLIPIYENKTLPIKLQLDNSLLGMVRFYSLMNQRLSALNDQSSLFKLSEKEVDDLRQMFFETSPLLLLTTLIAGLLHSLFEFLAFQSDVQHWKKKKSMEGTSHASLLMSALAALLNTVYLYDQREDTSLLVLGGAIIACLIELWKVFKSYRLKASVEKTSEKQKITDEVDSIVLYWTTRLSIPIAVTYSAYTINNYKFSGYYSWALDSCMALVYLLGFMNLVPQVVLNHRLKSVESVPITAFCFRALNTFVDDLFALVIPMPTLTRLSMLRDDLVFVVFLYQWYKYPKRKEEEEEEEQEEEGGGEGEEKGETEESKEVEDFEFVEDSNDNNKKDN